LGPWFPATAPRIEVGKRLDFITQAALRLTPTMEGLLDPGPHQSPFTVSRVPFLVLGGTRKAVRRWETRADFGGGEDAVASPTNKEAGRRLLARSSDLKLGEHFL